MLCSKQFTSASAILCEAIAALAKKLCSKVVDPNNLSAYVACRLLPLDKKPGVRPVGIGEVWRRLIGKAVMAVTNRDIIAATAPIQVCRGVEAAVHALRRVYDDSTTEAVLVVDADNAFNRFNRSAALHNVQQICPEIAQYIINTYRQPARLIVSNSEEELSSEEGVTQGDNAAMAKYSCSLMPLILDSSIRDNSSKDLKEVWYADDAASGGSLKDVRGWWEQLCERGPSVWATTPSLVRPG